MTLLMRREEDLRKHSTFEIGGRCDYYCEPATLEDLLECLHFCKDKDVPFRIIGEGSNILFADHGFPGCIISMVAFNRGQFQVAENHVTVSAGMRNYSFIKRCAEGGLCGMEFLSFIPGSIGGALAMNAGCINYTTGQYDEVGRFVRSVDVLNGTDVQTINKEEIQFAYRYSSLRQYLILSATFLLVAGTVPDFKKELSRNFRERARKMPMWKPSLGSMFKNPAGTNSSAGRLIEEAGLKGFQMGGIRISEQHANVFLNMGGGTAEDVLSLVHHVQDTVKTKFGIDLELEIDYIH